MIKYEQTKIIVCDICGSSRDWDYAYKEGQLGMIFNIKLHNITLNNICPSCSNKLSQILRKAGYGNIKEKNSHEDNCQQAHEAIWLSHKAGLPAPEWAIRMIDEKYEEKMNECLTKQ